MKKMQIHSLWTFLPIGLLITCLIFFIPQFVRAQDTVPEKKDRYQPLKPYHRNVFKLNPTPMILWNNSNVTLGYERHLWRNQTAGIQVGYLVFNPLVGNDTVANLFHITSREKRGINLALEYRFYLGKYNAKPVPSGVYIGPYLGYYGYQFKNGIDVLNTSVDSLGTLKGSFYMFNIGAMLGYQFVFWKRFTLDFILVGPSLSYYGGKVSLSGQFSEEEMKETYKEVYEKLKEKYPFIKQIDFDRTFEQNGTLKLTAFGLRYVIQLGFHF